MLFLQTVVCSECLTLKHRQHPCERLVDIDKELRDDLENKYDNCGTVKQNMEDDIEVLQEHLQELNDSLENNRSTIEEVFNSLRAFLEEIKENTLKQNKNLHSLLEMKVLENMEVAQRTVAQIDQALTFASNYLQSSSDAQLAVVYATIVQWIGMLSRRSVSTQVGTVVPFYSDVASFRSYLERAFGYFGEPPDTSSSTRGPLKQGPSHSHGEFDMGIVVQQATHERQRLNALQAATTDSNGCIRGGGTSFKVNSLGASSPVPSIASVDTTAAIHSAADAILSAGLSSDIFGLATPGAMSATGPQTSPTASDSGLSDHSIMSTSAATSVTSPFITKSIAGLSLSALSSGVGYLCGARPSEWVHDNSFV